MGQDFTKEFERDKDSLITLAQSQDATTQMSYDEYSRLEQVDNSSTETRISYSYNERGERSQMKISRSGAELALINYEYDANGNLTNLQTQALGQALSWERLYDKVNLPI
jgi:phosphoribosyl-AMP cyclohydrolase